MFETNFLKTSDDLNISYNYVETSGTVGVILLHQFRRDKSFYDEFANELKEYNFSSIAIDFRGHGNSAGKWTNFTDSDFQKMLLDLEAAKVFLEKKGKTKIFVVGASIGANTALNFAAQNSYLAGVVLLSPGIEYHGIIVLKSISINKVPTYIIVSNEDDYSYDSSKNIFQGLTSKKEMKVMSGDAHGTDMLLGTEAASTIIDWMRKI